ncbi:MAG TPA: ParB N-terminal domain-containing protein [Planctomycetota bacterium]|jgi:ParB family chromosome partitioning protein|nr:ParB N-terminal domain-containing protein [Planctomycetota bacterium]
MPAAKQRPKRRRKNVPAPAALEPKSLRAEPPAEVRDLAAQVEAEGGAVLAPYRDPYGGRWILFAALPIERVDRTPYQRDLSDAHVRRLGAVVSKVGRFLDPIVATRNADGTYWTPNGGHRLQAMRELGARTICALLVPEAEVATKILALNTEKAHNLREKALETIRMARGLAPVDGRKESECALEFEEAPFLTLGLCYEKKGRFSGGAYHSLLKRTDELLEKPIGKALEVREKRAAKIFEIDERVSAIVEKLKAQGLVSPYLKAFVVARINPIRFSKREKADFDETWKKVAELAARFDPEKVKTADLARMGGPPPAAEE